MGRILDKVSLDRLGDKELRVSLLCPYCKSTRITLAGDPTTSGWDGIDCPKCGAHILLDSMSLVVIKDPVPATRA
ncbi:MAG: hypothetical protein A3K59_10740 [Euryarchaeota archaeon RBG_19FT_COMBO_69_17]|nr:MAG: hypothetical protein A3K59_10740 [Euryarchaeota archaeon RBG_19FT_COMBO_69_17]